MELDLLKSRWEEYDRKLSQNLRLNEILLRKFLREKSRKEITFLSWLELLGLALLGAVAYFLIIFSIRLLDQPVYLIFGVLNLGLLGFYFTVGVRNVRAYHKINFYDASVVEIQRRVAKIEAQNNRLRMFSFVVACFFPFLLNPIFMKAISGLDFWQQPLLTIYLCTVAIALAAGLSLGWWMDRNITRKRLRNTQAFLEELKSYEQE